MANKLSVCLISVDFKTRNYKTPPYRKLAKTIFEMGEVVKPTLQITLLRSPLKPSEIRNQIIKTVFKKGDRIYVARISGSAWRNLHQIKSRDLKKFRKALN